MNQTNPNPVPVSRFSEARHVLQNVNRAFGLLWSISARRTLAYTLVTLLDALLPAAMAFVAKRIVDSVMASSLPDTLFWVLLECGLAIARSVLYHVDEFLKAYLGSRLAIEVNSLILTKTLNLRAQHFEDSDFNDRLARATKEAGSRPLHLVTHGFRLFHEAIRLASFAALLWSFSGWVVLAVVAGTTPQFLVQAWSASEIFRVQMKRTLQERQADYLKEVLTREYFIKEIKLFALGGYLLKQYLGHQENFFNQDQRLVRRTLFANFLTRLLSTLAFYSCYLFIAIWAVEEPNRLGDMTMLMLAVRGSQESFEGLLIAAAKIYESHLYMSNLFGFLGQESDEAWQELSAAAPAEFHPPAVTFDRVSFCYPQTDKFALQDISFSIRPGETLALVGPNGAGKTTLVKLLVRLYDPNSGQIRLDEKSVTDCPAAEIRRRVGVIFQDFVQFHLPVKDNIGLGWIPEIGNDLEIRRAAQKGGADSFVEQLEHGYDTMLGRYYGGAQLSIGQWQRIALARAFMRHSDVLILDEPTASLDAESEAMIFDRLREIKEGRTAILITHRFSTVRLADRILVLNDGKIVESGTHQELLKLGGLYARMFQLQAKGYNLG